MPAPDNDLAPRPSVRRRKTRRRRAGNYYLRLAVLAIGGFAFAYALSLLLIKAIHPYKLGYDEAQKIAVLNEQLAARRAENAILQKRVAYLNTPEGAEVEARRAGWQKPGETVYLIAPPAPPPSPAPPP